MCESKEHGGRRCPSSSNTTQIQLRNFRRTQNNPETQRKIEALKNAQQKYGNIVVVPPFQLPIPQETQKVMDLLSLKGGNPLIVGGSVRDAYFKDEPKDYDIEVHNMEINDIIRELRKKGYHVDEVGKQFGVLKIRTGENDDLDISVPRKDSLTGAGHRSFDVEVDENMGVSEAAQRRDFTLNALMYDSTTHTVIDPAGGVQDLKNKVLRHVSDAFAEDPLRPLRAFQFVGRFGFTLAPETSEMCRSIAHRASELPVERVRGEWEKFYLKSSHPADALRSLKDMGWDSSTPSFDKIKPEEVSKGFELTKDLSSEKKVYLRGAAAAQNMDEKESRKFLNHTMVQSSSVRKAQMLSQEVKFDSSSRAAVRQVARELGKKELSVQDWHTLQQTAVNPHPLTNAVVSQAKIDGVYSSPPQDFIMGRDLIPLFPERKPGPWMGQALSKIQLAQDEGKFSSYDEGIQWSRENV